MYTYTAVHAHISIDSDWAINTGAMRNVTHYHSPDNDIPIIRILLGFSSSESVYSEDLKCVEATKLRRRLILWSSINGFFLYKLGFVVHVRIYVRTYVHPHYAYAANMSFFSFQWCCAYASI